MKGDDVLPLLSGVTAAGPEPGSGGAEPDSGEQRVARVVLDVPHPHLDRPFDYLVPEELDDVCQPGVRVKVRFAGQQREGFVVARAMGTEHGGRLASISSVVSPEVILDDRLLALCRAVADQHAGVLADVLRLAIPPRHARAEKAAGPPEATPPEVPEPGPWAGYRAGPAFLRHLADGGAPAAVWTCAPPAADPELDWPHALAVAAATALSAGRGVVIVVPDNRDVERVDAALTAVLGAGRHVALTAAQGPQARYSAWLSLRRGRIRCVVGNRAAAFAPVADLGLVAWWDDGDDLHEEPRAPYPHVHDVLAERARLEGCALLSAGYARTAWQQLAVEEGWAHGIVADPATVRARAPRVLVAGEGAELERDPAAAAAHLPSIAWRTARAALADGPVLVQVPRRGYAPALSCQVCRTPARCAACHGPLAVGAAGEAPRCRWCGRAANPYECPECGAHQLRSTIVGARRTAEELGRAFPGIPVVRSGAGEVLASVPSIPALVIATPGAEPVAEQGYSAVLLLDGWALVDRPELDAGLEALRRWLAAASLCRAGAKVVLAGVSTEVPVPAVEALVRWDPVFLAARELAERRELALPPASVLAVLEAERHALADALTAHGLDGPRVERLGPLPVVPIPGREPSEEQRQRVILRVPRVDAAPLAKALVAMKAVRSARKDRHPVAVRMPADSLGA